MLSLDALPQKLDEIVRLSSNAARQQAEESTFNDFYSVSGFQDLALSIASCFSRYQLSELSERLDLIGCHQACAGF